MAGGRNGTRLLRGGGPHVPVTFVELFFDLVYVLAVTQLTHLLVMHLTVVGAVQTLILLLATWWAWVDTAWVTNWFNPDRPAVRMLLVAVMLLSLVMSAVLPNAYGDRGLWFAGAYAAMQIGRTAFAWLVLDGEDRLRRNFARILVWKIGVGALFVLGGFATEPVRLAVWSAAVLVEYAAAAVGFHVPGLGRSGPADWTISGGHLAERCQLFLLIALGESIIVSGINFGNLRPGPATVAAFASAFLGSVALWWIYFARGAGAATEVIASAPDPGRLGRSAYTYHHLPMVAGIIVTAVGDERVINHPTGHPDVATVVTVLGGPALFLVGHVLFKRVVFGRYSGSRLVAVAVLAALTPVGPVAPPLLLGVLATSVLVILISWETWIHRSPERVEV
jgi:low temperature requirement protein LtrA